MKSDITIGEAKEKICPFIVNEGKHIFCIGDKCMSWEFTSEQKSIPLSGGGFTVGNGASDNSGICKLLRR